MFNSSSMIAIKQLKYNVNPLFKLRPRTRIISPTCLELRSYCTIEDKDNTKSTDAVPKRGGFAKAFEKFSMGGTAVDETKEPTFLNLLRYSKFVDLGDPEGKIVVGSIFHVVEDDLYVDFGWKFHCVVPRPAKNGDEYVRGAKVRLAIKDLELSSRFLGSEKDLTLLEADCTLLGLSYSRNKKESLSIS